MLGSFVKIFICLCVFSLVAACVSPPIEADSSTTPKTSEVTTIIPTQVGIMDATLFPTPTQERLHPVTTPVTQPPENIVCLIYEKEESFTNNKNAMAINLVNPPMYLNYTIIENITGIQDRDVYYKITIRDKKTGEIFNQIGQNKVLHLADGTLTVNLNHSDILKILSVGNIQIEKEGNGIKINTEIWVKPAGNLDSSFDRNRTRCKNWPETRWERME